MSHFLIIDQRLEDIGSKRIGRIQTDDEIKVQMFYKTKNDKTSGQTVVGPDCEQNVESNEEQVDRSVEMDIEWPEKPVDRPVESDFDNISWPCEESSYNSNYMTDGQSGEQEPIATTSFPPGAEDGDGVEDWSDLEDDGDNDGDLIQLFAIE